MLEGKLHDSDKAVCGDREFGRSGYCRDDCGFRRRSDLEIRAAATADVMSDDSTLPGAISFQLSAARRCAARTACTVGAFRFRNGFDPVVLRVPSMTPRSTRVRTNSSSKWVAGGAITNEVFRLARAGSDPSRIVEVRRGFRSREARDAGCGNWAALPFVMEFGTIRYQQQQTCVRRIDDDLVEQAQSKESFQCRSSKTATTGCTRFSLNSSRVIA